MIVRGRDRARGGSRRQQVETAMRAPGLPLSSPGDHRRRDGSFSLPASGLSGERGGASGERVRGDYQKETNQPSPTQAQLYQQTVLPLAVGMDTTCLNVSIQWVNQGNNTTLSWDSAPKDVKSINSLGEYVTNSVQVTVTYTWAPGLLLGRITMTSVSQLPMSF